MQELYNITKSAAINSIPLFADLSFFQKRFIESRSQIVEFEKGDIVYKKGSPPDYFYCMISGRLEAYHPQKKAKRRGDTRIAYVRKGEYFGSISSLTGKPHSLSTRALNDSLVLRIDKKEFEHILHKIPRLAIFLTRSLSRRMSQKPFKDIFESKIIAVYGVGDLSDPSLYTKELASNIKRESGKKVTIIKSSSITKVKDVSPTLSSLTKDYHYILVDVLGSINRITFDILKQSDICHIVSVSDRASLSKASLLAKRLEGALKKHAKGDISIIVKEDGSYKKTSYIEKTRILKKDIMATLPCVDSGFKKVSRRIARETTGVMTGLALGSGAAIGFSHIGVLKVIEKEKIPIDIISGTSIGAFIGTLWAAGFKASEIEELALSFKSKLKTLFLADPILPIRGLIKGRAVERVLKPYLGEKTFRDIVVPIKVVACDIKNRREYIIDRGRLIDAVMASIAIPGVFEPVLYDGIQLVDGGIVNPLPVSVLSKSGIKKIIAVNALPGPQDPIAAGEGKLNIYSIIVNSFQAMEYTIAANSFQQADIYLHPVPRSGYWYQFYKAKLFIKMGEGCMRERLSEIKRLVNQKG
ncbi:MAG: patatin-like phospholipase family protein [Candidatus Omnitrophota bacterium]